MSATNTCPVCDWKIEKPVEVRTPTGVVAVCCKECAETLRKQSGKKSRSETRRG